jgi:hypothetical protein
MTLSTVKADLKKLSKPVIACLLVVLKIIGFGKLLKDLNSNKQDLV